MSIATPKKVAVAATERRERRAMPHRPWPLVHPEPRRVPKPRATLTLWASCGYRLEGMSRSTTTTSRHTPSSLACFS